MSVCLLILTVLCYSRIYHGMQRDEGGVPSVEHSFAPTHTHTHIHFPSRFSWKNFQYDSPEHETVCPWTLCSLLHPQKIPPTLPFSPIEPPVTPTPCTHQCNGFSSFSWHRSFNISLFQPGATTVSRWLLYLSKWTALLQPCEKHSHWLFWSQLVLIFHFVPQLPPPPFSLHVLHLCPLLFWFIQTVSS